MQLRQAPPDGYSLTSNRPTREKHVLEASGKWRAARALAAGASVVLLYLCMSSHALAANTFVNEVTGSDSNACTSASAPCATVGAGITKAGTTDTVTVAPGTYLDPATLGGSQSLVASGTTANTTLGTLYINGTGTVSGFTIKGNALYTSAAVQFGAAGTLTGNVVDPVEAVGRAVSIEPGSGSPTVSGNVITDDGSGSETAIFVNTDGSPSIQGNTISGFATGIDEGRGSATIRGNDISGIHNASTNGVAINLSFAGTSSVVPLIAGNHLHSPVPAGTSSSPRGVFSDVSGTTGQLFGATLRHNVIDGFGVAVHAGNTSPTSFTMDGDLVTGSYSGINAVAESSGTGRGAITATNVTLAGNETDISVLQTNLTLRSSIVEDAIFAYSTAACTITTSRGPTLTGGGNGCTGFQTTAGPGFADAAAGNYHLASSSAMIDAGDNSLTHAESVDIDGDPRKVPKLCGGTALPDIGADEYSPDCTPPETTITSGPAEGSSAVGASSFSFSSNEAGSSFVCSLDGVPFTSCTSPTTYGGLALGPHAFRVRATDSSGNNDPTPAVRNWTIRNPGLTVVKSGAGAGTVTSSPAGISCGDACTAELAPGPISLSAAPSAGSEFTGWSGGGCSGTGTCQVTLGADTTVTATFAIAEVPPTPPSSDFSLGKVTLNRKKGTAGIQVLTPGPGQLKLSGKRIKTVQRPAVEGANTITVALLGKARRALLKSGKATAKVTVTFTPTGGTAASETKSVGLRFRKHRR